MRIGIMAVVALVVAGVTAGGVLRGADAPARSDPMAEAAAGFVAALRLDLRERAVLGFDDPNRLDWHYIPRGRRGVSFKEMNDAERVAAHALLRAGLSGRGNLKTMQIMEMESVLRGVEEAQGLNAGHRDPALYFVTVFGEPEGGGAWGWRFEGHHVSLNFSSATGEVAVTPAFLGSNPGEVRSGAKAGLRVLAAEEDLARELLGSLDQAQRAEAVIETSVPGDILLAPGEGAERLGEARGLEYAQMTGAQQGLVEALLEEWTGNLERRLGEAQLARIRGAGPGEIRFVWIGSDEPGRPHYYRLRGPTFVIEYDNTQNDANHIHTVWRDLERDFGADLLRDHLHEDHDR